MILHIKYLFSGVTAFKVATEFPVLYAPIQRYRMSQSITLQEFKELCSTHHIPITAQLQFLNQILKGTATYITATNFVELALFSGIRPFEILEALSSKRKEANQIKCTTAALCLKQCLDLGVNEDISKFHQRLTNRIIALRDGHTAELTVKKLIKDIRYTIPESGLWSDTLKLIYHTLECASNQGDYHMIEYAKKVLTETQYDTYFIQPVLAYATEIDDAQPKSE